MNAEHALPVLLHLPQGLLFAPHGPIPSPFAPDLDWRIFLVLLGAILIASTFHQFGHALVADRLGDPLPRKAGRLGLNPFAHLSVSGFAVLVLSLLFSLPVGWGKPVPTNPENYKTGLAPIRRTTAVGLWEPDRPQEAGSQAARRGRQGQPLNAAQSCSFRDW